MLCKTPTDQQATTAMSNTLNLKDNNWQGVPIIRTLSKTKVDGDVNKFVENIKSNLDIIAEKKISEILDNSKNNILIFPSDWKASADLSGDETILSLIDKDSKNCKIKTGNIMGFLSTGKTKINITSRFDDDKRNFFLHYMLKKVNHLNVINFDTTTADDEIFSLLVYFFPKMLKDALAQGVYKEYRLVRHNDFHARGTLDVPRFIKQDTPFVGKVAYNTREYSFDNAVTQLVRHTIEEIKKTCIKNILTQNAEIRENVEQIERFTPSYVARDREKIIKQNLRPFKHSYFPAWRELQKLCLAILRHKKNNFQESDKNIKGVLFDGAWLWEEYLWTILETCHSERSVSEVEESIANEKWMHPKNKSQEYGLQFFKETSKPQIYPDFYIENKIVADAKYIPLDKKNSYDDERATSIYYKTLAYMLRLNTKRGFLLYPCQTQKRLAEKLTVIDEKNENIKRIPYTLTKIPFIVPCNAENWSDFCEKMKRAEQEFLKSISKSAIV